MTANIKYTVKYHPNRIKKIAKILLLIGGTMFILCNLIWLPFSNLPPELKAMVIIYIIPDIILQLDVAALLLMGIASIMMCFKWRRGTVELTDEKLIIDGSYYASIRLVNMWEVYVINTSFSRWNIKLDSKTDAVQMKFETEEEFEAFSERLFELVKDVENIKLDITAD